MPAQTEKASRLWHLDCDKLFHFWFIILPDASRIAMLSNREFQCFSMLTAHTHLGTHLGKHTIAL